MKNIVGLNIKKFRKEKKLTQMQLADLIGKHESSIRKYEKGLTDIPNEVIMKIADTLEVTPAELLSVEDWETKYNPDGRLAEEVKVYETLKNFFGDYVGNDVGDDAVELLQQFQKLNHLGRKKLLSDIEDLTMIPKYQKKD